MVMRFNWTTEEPGGERRARQVPVGAYRQGNELKLGLDLPGAGPGLVDVTVEWQLLSGPSSVRTDRESHRH